MIILAIEASVLASFLASFTDWYFYGVLFHERYHSIPGVWIKYKDKRDEMRSVTLGTAFHSLSSFVFVFGCGYLHLTTLSLSLGAAVGVWLMVPVPLLAALSVFLRWIGW